MSENIPLGFKPLDCPPSLLVVHHFGVAPVLLKTLANAVQPFYVWCPQCGFKVSGSTIESAIVNWNDHMADPGRTIASLA